jgi:hypothetical protein
MTVEKRLEIMEKELKGVKRQKILSWGVVAVAFCLIAIVINPKDNVAAQGKLLDEIRAKHIVLVDESGMERAVLSLNSDKDMVGLVMQDKDGGPCAIFGTSGLSLRDESGATRAILALNPDNGEPGLVLFNQTGRARTLLLVDKDGPALSLRDEKGNERWFTPAPVGK